MMRSSALVKFAVVVLVIGAFMRLGSPHGASWASTRQDTERQTVPTRTPTPGPVTPTAPPPPATNTPLPPPIDTPTETPSPTPSPTLDLTVTATETGDALPTTLPAAGGKSWLWVGVLVLASGGLLLLAGAQVRRHAR